MTIAQQLEQIGINKGINIGEKQGLEKGINIGEKQGFEKGKQEVARNMLTDGMDLRTVMRLTGLSE
ncbi:Rpn family recombination-promoting nuclease/putative transposase, partial [Salmonella enterica]|nr:Rpn family recombination-promoting nuclease/putative transposase [Salmonella enterica]